MNRNCLTRVLPRKPLVRWKNHFPLFPWNSLSLTGRSRI